MKVVLIFALLVLSQASHKMTHEQKTQYEEIIASKTWAGFFLKMAEVSVMVGGPLDQLIEAIEDGLADNSAKKIKADENFDQRTAQHNAEVTRLEKNISNTQTEIEGLKDTLIMLAEQKAAIEEENRMLIAANVSLKNHIQEATTRRNKENEAFQTAAAEFEESASAVQECLDLLYELMSNPSFIQVKKVKQSFAQVHQKLQKNRNPDAAIVLALIEVANSQEFTNQGALGEVIAKFQEIAGNLASSAAKAAADEAQAATDYATDMTDSNNEINANSNQISGNNDMLVTNAANTEENTNILFMREADLRDLEEELTNENNRYEMDTQIYNDLCDQLALEKQACSDALSVLATADFSDYVSDRVSSQDGLVSSGMKNSPQHGAGTDVFNFDYE